MARQTKKRTVTDAAANPQRKRAKDDDPTNELISRWWSVRNGDEAQSRLWTWVERLRTQWATDAIGDLIHEAIYANKPIAAGGHFDGTTWRGIRAPDLTPLNVIKSLVDTASARLTKIRSMPCITAQNATYDEQRFAREVSDVLRTKMGGHDVEVASPLLVRDFCIRGTAIGKVRPEGGDTLTERIPIYELVWDHREAQYGLPRQIAHVRPEQREVMLARYPKFRAQILAAPRFTRMDPWMQFTYQGPTFADLIEVATSWHLRSGPDEDDGQEITVIRGTVVSRRRWTAPRYPFGRAYWTAPIRGLRGDGIVFEHSAAQEWINDILMDARDAIHNGSQLKVMTSRAANVNKNHMKRGRGVHMVEIDGPVSGVQYIAPDPVSKQAWSIAMQMSDKMYAVSGIAQWSAEANKPLGTNASGKALDTMNDNQSDRFAYVETSWQQCRVALGQAHVDVAQSMRQDDYGDWDETPDPPAELASWIDDHDWDRVDIDGGDYCLTIEPTNFITGTRGGKLEEIAEAAKAGLIPDPSMTATLLDEPDIQRMNMAILGPIHRIQKCMSDMPKLEVDYIDVAPDDFMNLDLAKTMALGELNEAMSKNAPDAVIQRFMHFLSDIASKKSALASLPGAQANTTVAQPNAGAMLPSAPPMPGGAAPGPGLPPGMPS